MFKTTGYKFRDFNHIYDFWMQCADLSVLQSEVVVRTERVMGQEMGNRPSWLSKVPLFRAGHPDALSFPKIDSFGNQYTAAVPLNTGCADYFYPDSLHTLNARTMSDVFNEDSVSLVLAAPPRLEKTPSLSNNAKLADRTREKGLACSEDCGVVYTGKRTPTNFSREPPSQYRQNLAPNSLVIQDKIL